MAKLNEDKFDVFDDPTPPRADGAGRREEEPTGETADPPPPPRQGGRPRAPRSAEKPAEMSKALRNHWRTTLQNAARKLARDREQLDESEQAWADTVTEARALGIAPNVLVAAAADADVELPE
jgi:hypothetical protein